jgi:diguanylate cyclase (GGDEF)-like protein
VSKWVDPGRGAATTPPRNELSVVMARSRLPTPVKLRETVRNLVLDHRRIIDDYQARQWCRRVSAVLERLPADPSAALLLDLRAALGITFSESGACARDAVRAAEIHRRHGLLLRAAMAYGRAAVLTSFTDDVASALDLATEALVCLDERPTDPRALAAEERHHLKGIDGQTEPALRSVVYNSLGILCTEFYAYDRARELYRRGLTDAEICSEPGRTAALLNNLAVSHVYRCRNEVFQGKTPARSGLCEAERVACRLAGLPLLPRVTQVMAPRLLADVLCEQGRVREALESLRRASRIAAGHEPGQLQAKIDLTTARCLRTLGEHDLAKDHLDLASRRTGAHAARSLRLTIVQERSLLREETGDLDGAIEDAWTAGEMIWRRHREQLGGLAAQLWDRAQAEGERRRLQHRADELARRAGQDPLTGLANRRSMLSFLAALPAHEPVFVLFADVDAFKRINDGYGHASGDEVLRGIAEVLDGSVRERDRAARWGGEEFLVVVTRVEAAAACEVAERIRSGVSQLRWAVGGAQLKVTMSIGVAGGYAACVDDIVQRADEALYQAKQTGRDRVVQR